MTPSSPLPGAPARPGPGAARPGAAPRLAFLALSAAAIGCATGAPPGPPPAPPEDRPADAPAVDEAREAGADALEEVGRLVDAGRHHAAAVLADSLYYRTRSRPALEAITAAALDRQARALELGGELEAAADRLRELLRRYPERAGEDVPARLARLHIARADDPAAAATLLRRPGEGDEAVLSLVRRAARSMSVGELETVLGGEPAGAERADAAAAVRGTLLAELAVARARADRPTEARSAARRALEMRGREADVVRARSVLEGSVAPRRGPVRIGLLLPRSGRFSSVGDRLLEGVRLALEAHAAGRVTVELSTADTDAEGAEIRRLVRRLEGEGTVALLGPVESAPLARAAAARADSGRLLLSPTASRAAAAGPAVYTLWERGRRELEAARRLGRWMAGVLGGVPVGAVYPAQAAGRRAYLEFRRALGAGEAWMAAAHSYEPGSTTLEGPITAVSAFRPRAVFAPGGDGTSVLQMAPQLSYYGVRGALVAGGPAWSRPSTVRRLEPSYSQHRVLAAFVDRDDPDGPWSRFQAAYEKKYRRSLYGNVLPALGHDAALVVLRALEEVRPPRPRAVARRAADLEAVDGATGRFRLDPATGTVGRRVLLRTVRRQGLVPASLGEAREWLRSAGGLETARLRSRRQRAREAVRASGVTLTPSVGGAP